MIEEGVGPGHGSGMGPGLEFDVQVHVGDRRHPEVGPGGHVAPPVVLDGFLNVRSLVAGSSAKEQQGREEDRRYRDGKEPQPAPQQRLRPQAVQDSGGVELLPAQPPKRQHQQQRDEAQVEQAVQEQGAAVE